MVSGIDAAPPGAVRGIPDVDKVETDQPSASPAPSPTSTAQPAKTSARRANTNISGSCTIPDQALRRNGDQKARPSDPRNRPAPRTKEAATDAGAWSSAPGSTSPVVITLTASPSALPGA